VRLEEQGEERPAVPLSPLLNREAREAANRWLACFTPFLDSPDGLDAEATRRLLEQASALWTEGERRRQDLEQQAAQGDVPLLATLREALGELEAREGDLRRRLGRLAPNAPGAEVDLSQIRTKLAEAAARREVDSWGGSSAQATPRLELKTSPGNPGAALAMGLFSLGWLAFTTIHAVFMIGGMMAAFGPWALLLLLFYSMFWAVGLGAGWGAIRTGSEEQVELEGAEMVLRRRFLFWSSRRTYHLGPESCAYLAEPGVRQQGSAAQEVAVQDRNGREIRLATGRPEFEQQRLVTRLNDYVKGLGPDAGRTLPHP
jgi:hypothetical protein